MLMRNLKPWCNVIFRWGVHVISSEMLIPF
jgi:hypothetical protein